VENKGQTIWIKDDLKVIDENGESLEIIKISLSSYEPGGSGFIVFKGKSPASEGNYQKNIQLINGEVIISPPVFFHVASLATLRMKLEAFLDSFLSLWHPER
jgi:hypothetical protein